MQAAPALEQTPSRYHVWRSEGQPVSVRFRRQTMEWIESRTAAALSLSRNGSELTAGFLLGSRTVVNGRPVVVVEGAEPIGKSGDMDAQLRRLRTEGALVIGVYRAEARDGSSPSVVSADSEILEEMNGDGISLVIAADRNAECEPRACISVRTGGRCFPWSEPRPFPFGRSTSVDSGGISAPTRLWRPRSWWAVAFALLALNAAALLWLANAKAESIPEPGFGLFAEREGREWRLHWNSASPALTGAATVHVVIVDGSLATRYAMTRGQLNAGSLLYAPTNGNLSFSVEILTKAGKTARETLIVIHDTVKQRPPVSRRPSKA